MTINTKDAILKLEAHISNPVYTNGLSFEDECCFIWTAGEVLKLLKSSTEPPLLVMERFQDKMKQYSELNEFTHDRFVTSEKAVHQLIRVLIN